MLSIDDHNQLDRSIQLGDMLCGRECMSAAHHNAAVSFNYEVHNEQRTARTLLASHCAPCALEAIDRLSLYSSFLNLVL